MLRHTLSTVMITGILLGSATNSFAWDGQRKGFILGVGAGGGLASFKESMRQFEGERQSEFAIMTDFKLGYAPSNQVAIFWMSKVAWFGRTFEFQDRFGQVTFSESTTIINGVGGLGLTYYFKPEGSSPYLTGGFGFSSWGAPFEEGSETLYGSGMALGAGYEFSRHWSIEGNLAWGSPDDDTGFSINTLAVRFTINVLGY